MSASSDRHRCGSPVSAYPLIGIFCCIVGLAVQLFPGAAERIGADESGAWLIFGFGLFLVAASVLLAMKRG